jgi:type III pantothenate kinase
MPDTSTMELIAISVGNTRTRVGLFRGDTLEHSSAIPNTDLSEISRVVLGAGIRNERAPVIIASVNEPITNQLANDLAAPVQRRGGEIYRFGRDLAIPVQTALSDDSTVGQDRLLNALGAYSRAAQACIVIDAGTAITVDFVDGEGTFHGGAIAPGLALMLTALHEHTAALPQLKFEPPPTQFPFGKNTRDAMLHGVQAAARGMVHLLIERYAEFYEAYPQIIATGGDARTLFENDELVEHLVPDLTLLGIQAACLRVLSEDDD